MDKNPDFPFGMIQIAGVHNFREMEMLLEEGVDLVGIPLRLTVNAEDLTEAEAAQLSIRYPGKCCLITYLEDAAEITSLVQYLQVSWLQLHGSVDPDMLPALKKSNPDLHIIKSLIIGKSSEADLMHEMEAFSPWISTFITDTFNPETGAEGATGLTHDWAISRRLCQASPRPVILAGGLTPQNVFSAIQATRPMGVDAHTGVEDSSGIKSRESIRLFVREARRAFAISSRNV